MVGLLCKHHEVVEIDIGVLQFFFGGGEGLTGKMASG